MLTYENELYQKGINLIAGVDEAGRGPLAGPVFAACVIFKKGVFIEGVNDSKKLSAKKREFLFDEITKNAICYKIASVDENEIDNINILQATLKAMKTAITEMEIMPEYVLIDGDKSPDIIVPHQSIIKGDSLSFSIAAASILAKVARDRYIDELSLIYPNYQFEKHKGYGTKAHIEAIKTHGICPIHRVSFCKNFI